MLGVRVLHSGDTMKVLFVGRKRNAGSRGKVCKTDVMLLTDLEDDDIVAILSVDNHRFCYDLENLAQWFLQSPVAQNALPTLPESRAPVPAVVYKRVIREAHMRFPEFRKYFRSKTSDMSAAQRTFALTGVRRRASSTSDDMFSLDDLERFLLGDEDDDRTRRRRSRSRGRSRSPSRGRDDDDLAAMLPDLDQFAELMSDADLRELGMSLPSSGRANDLADVLVLGDLAANAGGRAPRRRRARRESNCVKKKDKKKFSRDTPDMARDVAEQIVAQLERSHVAVVLHRAENHAQGIAVRSGENGFLLTMYGGAEHRDVASLANGEELFFASATEAAAQMFALARIFDKGNGLRMFYVRVPYTDAIPQQPTSTYVRLHVRDMESERFTDQFAPILRAVARARL